MVVRPDTIVRLLSNVPVDPTYENVQYFDTIEQQQAFFLEEQFDVREFTRFTYVDQASYIRVPVNIEQLWNVNYLMYQNHAFSNKWFYAFVTRVEWASDASTNVYFTLDVFQTWWFHLKFFKSFVQRECVSDDAFGKNLIPENFDKGEYIANSVYKAIEDIAVQEGDPELSEHKVYIYTSYGSEQNDINVQLNGSDTEGDFNLTYIIPNTVKAFNGGVRVNDVYSGSEVTEMRMESSRDEVLLNEFIQEKTQKGQIDAISAMFTAPGIVGRMSNIPEECSHTLTVPRPGRLDGYIPKNNKMFTQPFCFIAVVNNSGDRAEFGFEYFDDIPDRPAFNIQTSIAGQPTIALWPKNYNGVNGSQYAILLNNFPLCSFAYSAYQNQLGLNRVGNTVGVVNNMVDFAQGMANVAANGLKQAATSLLANATSPTKAAAGVLSAGVDAAQDAGNLSLDTAQDVASAIATHVDRARAPMSVSGSSSPNLMFSSGNYDFFVMINTIRYDYAKRIDDYFSMYGYEVDQVKDLEFHSRQNWNYIKTIGCNVEGNCPAPVVDAIKAIFNRGVTLWHTGSFDYGDLSNPIRG